MRFLIGEYNGCLQRVVAGALRSVGYGVDVATSDSELRSLVVTIDYELIILDTNLPEGEATVSEVVRDLRRDGFRIPILVVSGNGGVDQLVKILDSGADDCLVKAFNTREMLARVRALLRRPPSVQESILRLGNMECDAAASEVRCLGRPIDLKRKERQLLTILLRSNGRVVSKELLVTMLSEWSNEVSVNAIEALVSRLRKRLRAVQSGVAINTVHGTGYRLISALGRNPLTQTSKESAHAIAQHLSTYEPHRGHPGASPPWNPAAPHAHGTVICRNKENVFSVDLGRC